jgi:flagellin-like hook-associated protein FlgL
MRVSTNQIYQVSTDALNSNLASSTTEQQRISSGIRIDAVSQDIAAVTQASGLLAVKAQASIFNSNLDELDMRYSESDQSLSVIHGALGRISEALAQSQNAALSSSDRSALGVIIQSDAAAIAAELRRSDSQGRPLYSGGVADANHPALLVRPGQTLSAEITLSQADQDSIAALAGSGWATGTGLASSTSAQRADAHSLVKRLQASALDARQQVGGRWQLVSTYQNENQAVSDAANVARTNLVGTDMVKSISDLSVFSAQLQAARSLFVRISANSLFDSLR